MADNSDYQYGDQWERKPRLGWKQALIGVGILLVIITVSNIFKQYKLTNPDAPTPTVAYIEYGSRRIVSVIPQEVNYPAPELALTTLEGEPANLADYRDKIVLVNTWATWCPGCEGEMPELQAYAQAHTQDNFLILGVNAEENTEQINPFIVKMGLTFPILLDTEKEVYRVFKSNHIPSSYVIDRSGTVRLAWHGPVSLEVMEIYVTPLLRE
ncbi:MAG: TlpA family protein disulfide reductase [Anaerolineales bacterium]|nr:TlpA family protein disulfide reductase [Chloroflexota bacterium]MBL6982860.1 TlpA family protein disulfide reductase [Anaerolineales bacterium]